MPLELSTFGPVALRDNTALVLQGRRKVLALLAYLAHKRAAVDRAELATRFWPTSAEGRAKHSLRQALSELRSVLGEGIEIGPTRVRLHPEALTIDTHLFVQEIASERWSEALARCQGDFLSGLEDVGDEAWRRWLARERATFGEQLLLAKVATGENPVAPFAAHPPHPVSVEEQPESTPPPGHHVTRDFSLGQLGTLSTDARALLETAAIIGPRCSRALVCRVAGLSDAGFGSALEELSSRGLFFTSATHPGQYEFATLTARQRIYEVMAGTRRRALHAAVSDALAHGVGEETATTTAEHHALLSVAGRPTTNWPAIIAITLTLAALLTIALLLRR